MHRRMPLTLCLIASLASTASAQEFDRSGVRPEVLSLPDGPGSVQGLGDTFEPNPATGTAAYSVAIDVPPGVGGFVPSLGLGYSSAGGNGPVGLGWQMSLPMVARSLERGLPRYDGADRFTLVGLGGDTLVETADGDWRSAVEGAFVRVRRTADGWSAWTPDGVRYDFGHGNARITDGERVMKWLLARMTHPIGHVIDYAYVPGPDGHPYLSEVIYNDFSPAVRNAIRLHYEGRPDALTDHRAGFPVTVGQRLARIEVRHGARLIRTYALSYTMGMGLSRLARVELVGEDGQTGLPPLSLSYPTFDPMRSDVVTVENAPGIRLGQTAEIDDVDGDALPDVLVADPAVGGGQHQWYANLDGAAFADREAMPQSPAVYLSTAGVQLADMDGDGSADLVARVSDEADGFRYYRGGDPTGFGDAVVMRPNPSVGLDDPDVRLVDLNLDRLADWMRTDPATDEVVVRFNLGGGVFSAAERLDPIDPVESVRFGRGARLADMNGDGLSDVVRVRGGSVRYWPSTGFGRFAPPVALAAAPELDDGELGRLQVRDLNGDGLADLATVGVREVRAWLNLSSDTLSDLYRIPDTPVVGADTVVRTADMNGNGSQDIVWIEPGGGWRYLDLLVGGGPGLLTGINNGLGQTTRISYTSIGEMRRLAREEGIAWTLRSPIGQCLVGRVELDDGIDAPRVRQFFYADGFYDGESREFRGFRRARVIDEGDVDQPSLVTDTVFDVGAEVEALEGKPLQVQRATLDRRIFDVTTYEYRPQSLMPGVDGREVVFAPQVREQRDVFEGRPEPTTLLSEWVYDEHGNPTLEARYGRIEGGDVAFGDDEVIIERAFAKNPERWIVQAPSREITQNIDRVRLAETRTFYDGDAFEGLAAGRVDVGLPTRIESWIEGDVFAPERRARFDDFGNEVEFFTKAGVHTRVTYDAESHTFPIREAMENPDGPDLGVDVEYDTAHGGMTRFTNINGHVTDLRYDPLHRLALLARPGDSVEQPTTAYDYHLGAPYSWVETQVRHRPGEAQMRIERALVDGAGRDRCVLQRVDAERWATADCQSYGARGWARRVAYPRFVDGPGMPPMDAIEGITRRFDATGRTTEEIEVDGAMRRTDYAPLTVTRWDENDTDPDSMHADTPTVHRFDGLERLREVVELQGTPDEASTDYTYDALGNLVELVDAEGSALRWTFDGRSRRRSFDDPNGGEWRFEYNAGDQLTSKTGPAGRQVRVEYDALARLTEEWHRMPAAEETLFARLHYDIPHPEHDGMANTTGLLSWVEDAAGTAYLGYDERSRVRDHIRRWSDGSEDRERTLHDNEDRVLRRVFPDGTALDYAYDDRGNPTAAGDFVMQTEWTAFNALAAVTFDNGLTRRNTYDARNRLLALEARSGEALVHHTTLDRDLSSRVVRVDDLRPDVIGTPGDHSKLLDYDARYRLRTSAASMGQTEWTYDRVGNIRGSLSPRPDRDLAYDYDDPEHPDRVTAIDGDAVGYDAAGRVIDDGACQLEYDAAGRLVGVTSAAGTEEYVHDYRGERIIRRTSRAGESELRILAEDVERVDGQWRFYAFVGSERAVRFGPGRLPRVNLDAGDDGAAGPPPVSGRGGTFPPAALGLVALIALLVARRRGWRQLRLAAAVVAVVGIGCDDGEPGDPIADLQPAFEFGDAGEGTSDAAPAPPGARPTLYYVRDHAGSVVAATSTEGSMVTRATYDPYGMRTDGAEAIDGWGFSGQRYDPGSGLVDFGARQFSARLGRFYDVDPIVKALPTDEPLRYQAYTYAAADPVNLTDAAGALVVTITGNMGISLANMLGVQGASGVAFEIDDRGRIVETAVVTGGGFNFSTPGSGAVSGGVEVSIAPGTLSSGIGTSYGVSGNVGPFSVGIATNESWARRGIRTGLSIATGGAGLGTLLPAVELATEGICRTTGACDGSALTLAATTPGLGVSVSSTASLTLTRRALTGGARETARTLIGRGLELVGGVERTAESQLRSVGVDRDVELLPRSARRSLERF